MKNKTKRKFKSSELRLSLNDGNKRNVPSMQS